MMKTTIINKQSSEVQGHCLIVFVNTPSWVFSSISCSSTKSMLVIPHVTPNFSKNAHITAKLGSLSHEASLSDAIFNITETSS